MSLFKLSNLTPLKIVFLLFLTVAQTSCLREASNPTSAGVTDDSTADFRPLVVTGQSIATSENPRWKIPTAKTYSFRLCLLSRMTDGILPVGQDFRIKAPDGTSKEATTDNLGCLDWEEQIPFNYAADSMYIEKERILIGEGTYRGTSVLRYAVNPWLQYRSDSGDEVVDLARGNANISEAHIIPEGAGPEALSGLFSRGSSKNLYLELMPGLEIIETGDLPDGKLFDIIVQLKPYIEPLNLNQDRDKIYLNNGRFKVYVQLVGEYVGESSNPQRVILTPELEPQIIDIHTDSTIVFKQLSVPLKRRITTGQVQLAVKVVPEDTPENFDLNPYEGLYNAGAYDGLFKKAWVTQVRGSQEPEGFDYASHIQQTTNFDELRQAQWAHSLPPVEYSMLDPRFVQVKQGETSTDRTVIYRVSTRVTDGVSGGIVRLQPFTIIHPDGRVEETQTNHEGILFWTDELHHKYYMREHRILEKVKIIHKRSNNQANQIIALNPWDEGWTFGADIRTGILANETRRIFQAADSPEEQALLGQTLREQENAIDWLELSDEELNEKIEAMNARVARLQELKPNLLFVDAFRYQTIRFRYVIDEFLTLNVKKAVVMAMDPLVQRDTLYRGRIFEPLRDGVYLAKIALVKYFIDPFQNGIHLIQCDPSFGNCPCPEGDNTCNEASKKYHVQPVSDGGEARKGQYTTVIKKLIRVQAGRITTPLEFSMRDLRMMSVRSQIMVQLETIDERALLQGNIVDQRIDELERHFFELNPDSMTEEERLAFQERYGYLPEALTPEERERKLAELAATQEEQRKNFLEFVEETEEELEASRREQSAAQRRRFEMVDEIERGLADGNPRAEYEKENPLISLLRREDWRDIIQSARDNLSQMELQSKAYWDGWGQEQFNDLIADVNHGSYIPQFANTRPNFANFVRNVETAVPEDDYVSQAAPTRRNYADYLLTAQTFLIGQGLEGVVLSERDLERMAINNYTQNPVAPIIDLNLLRNKSGLMRRSFIGPCTLVENDNMSEMRPTDTVDEKYCDRIDCGETLYEPRTPLPDNTFFENSAHHDSLKPFAGMHVDEVIAMHRDNERRYEMEMDALSQMGNFVESYNMSYVSLTNKPLTKYKQGCTFDGQENCFPETQENRMISHDFMELLNEKSLPNLLGRFFLVNPMHELQEVNREVIRVDSLEPLWNRTKKSPGMIMSFLTRDTGEVPMDYSQHPGNMYNAVGNHYLRRRFGSPEDRKINHARVSQWLSEGLDKLKLDDSLRICNALAMQVADHLVKSDLVTPEAMDRRLFNDETDAEAYLLHKCMAHVRYLPESDEVFLDGVHFDRRFKILKAGKYEHIRGMNMNINVGVDFGISTYEDVSTTTSAGVNDSGVLGITGAGIGAALGGVPGAAIGASAGLIIASMSSSRSDGVNRAQGTSVNAATFLVAQKADFHINILEHEKCLALKFGKELIENLDDEYLHLKDGLDIDSPEVRKSLGRGFMVCNGTPSTQPVEIPESYYYITQHFMAGDMLDDVNLLNHVWLLALRGKRDYNEFIRILQSKEIGPDGEVIAEGEIYDYPLSRLGRVYKQVIPTFPGLYSVRE